MQEEVGNLEAVLQNYVTTGQITEEQIDERVNAYLPKKAVISNRLLHRRPSVKQLITSAENPPVALGQVALLISQADSESFYTRQEQLLAQKKEALSTLKEKFVNVVNISFDDNIIKMTNIINKIESKPETSL